MTNIRIVHAAGAIDEMILRAVLQRRSALIVARAAWRQAAVGAKAVHRRAQTVTVTARGGAREDHGPREHWGCGTFTALPRLGGDERETTGVIRRKKAPTTAALPLIRLNVEHRLRA